MNGKVLAIRQAVCSAVTLLANLGQLKSISFDRGHSACIIDLKHHIRTLCKLLASAATEGHACVPREDAICYFVLPRSYKSIRQRHARTGTQAQAVHTLNHWHEGHHIASIDIHC